MTVRGIWSDLGLRAVWWTGMIAGAFLACGASTGRATVIDIKKTVTSSNVSINQVPGYQKVVVCSAGPFTVQAGDVITGHAQAEVTWAGASGTDRIMVGCGIVVATSPTAVDNTSAGFIGMLSKWSGNNLCLAKEGAEVATRTGSYRFGANYTNVYINWVHYGQTVPLNTPGPNAVIPASYAEIVGVLERGISRYATTSYINLPTSGGSPYVPVLSAFTPYVQYSYGPMNIPANSIVDVRWQVEGSTPTNEGTIVPRLGRRLIQTTSQTSTAGTALSRDIQGGATEKEHHATFSSAGAIYYPSAVSNAYFNGVLWAYGTGSKMWIETEGSYLYGGYAIEVRPRDATVGFWKDSTRNIASVTSTQQVLYSVGPINIPANQTVEVRWQGGFTPTVNVPFNAKIVRATSATATTGTEIQRPLWHKFDPSYVYVNQNHSTAERVSSSLSGQYYNVVVSLPNAGSNTLGVNDWGQLEVLFR